MIFGWNKKYFKKNSFKLYIFVSFLILIINVQQVFAVSQSANYKFTGQINQIAGKLSGTAYNTETGGQPIGGKTLGSSYNVQQGSVFSETAVTAATVTTAVANGGGANFSTGESAPKIVKLGFSDLGQDQIKIIFETDKLAVSYIQYGKEGEYDLITASEASFAINHEFVLYNLIPNTKYNFIVNLRNTASGTAETASYEFATLRAFKAVPNADAFIAKAKEGAIELSWRNPEIIDFAGAKLVRGTLYYPASPSEGVLLFDGGAEAYVDYNVVPNQKYYYTLFTYDTSSNYSSGAIISSIILAGVEADKKDVESAEEIPAKVGEKEDIIPARVPELPEGVVLAEEEIKIEERIKLKDGAINFFSLVKQSIAKEYEKVTRIFENLLLESGEQINNIKNGIIDKNGKLRQDIYELLTADERKEIEKIIAQPLPPKFEHESVIKISPFSLDAAEADANWRIFAGSDSLLSISADVFNKPVNVITITLQNEGYVLAYNDKTGNYEAIIRAPDKKGKYQMIVQVFYTDNTYEEISRVVLVDPYGYVYAEKFGSWSWQKPWQVFLKEDIKLSGVKVTLYTLDKANEWVIWSANLYDQFNPQTTNDLGEFVFLVPPGKYYLSAQAKGYKDFKSDEFEVLDDIVNLNIKLNRSLSWQILARWVLIIGVSAGGLFLVAFLTRKRII